MRDLRIATPTGTHVSMHIAQLTDGTALLTLHDCGKPIMAIVEEGRRATTPSS